MRAKLRLEVARRVAHRSARALRSPRPSSLGRRVAHACQVPYADVERTAATPCAARAPSPLSATALVGASAREAYELSATQTERRNADARRRGAARLLLSPTPRTVGRHVRTCTPRALARGTVRLPNSRCPTSPAVPSTLGA